MAGSAPPQFEGKDPTAALKKTEGLTFGTRRAHACCKACSTALALSLAPAAVAAGQRTCGWGLAREDLTRAGPTALLAHESFIGFDLGFQCQCVDHVGRPAHVTLVRSQSGHMTRVVPP